MRCIVTAGPTYESLDNVRRLTNFSTGRSGTDLAAYLSRRGHEVCLLIGEQATYTGKRQAREVQLFTSTANLAERLKTLAKEPAAAVFHAAAVSDFTFGTVWLRSSAGELSEVKSGKISTRQGTLLAELVPTPKIIGQLRAWFPKAVLVGWKFEVEGDRSAVLELAARQVAECRTDACVANGPGYGAGFGLLRPGSEATHLPDTAALFAALEKLIP
jgi:phosphopantothenoylcysteine decarboxylase/phosphopantothenate--cysteine ligase